jgi:hypothetical protein
MPDPKDDLAAVRTIAEALAGFDAKEQERILRWVREKVGLTVAREPSTLPTGSVVTFGAAPVPVTTVNDLKSFVLTKKPKSDVQFAATVAYYYRFVAPPDQRKEEIMSTDLQEACRLVGRERFTVPGQTLRNAHNLGLLNRGSAAGSFAINSVGENLVDVALPEDSSGIPRGRLTRKKKKKKKRKAAKKTARG